MSTNPEAAIKSCQGGSPAGCGGCSRWAEAPCQQTRYHQNRDERDHRGREQILVEVGDVHPLRRRPERTRVRSSGSEQRQIKRERHDSHDHRYPHGNVDASSLHGACGFPRGKGEQDEQSVVVARDRCGETECKAGNPDSSSPIECDGLPREQGERTKADDQCIRPGLIRILEGRRYQRQRGGDEPRKCRCVARRTYTYRHALVIQNASISGRRIDKLFTPNNQNDARVIA